MPEPFVVHSSGTEEPKPSKAATAIHTTTIQHPPLPSTASTMERIALPMVFGVVNVLLRDEAKRAEFAQYMTPLRDALNEAYPED